MYGGVRLWWLEVDGESGRLVREIGFNENGSQIVAGPFKGNYGLLVDSPMSVADIQNCEQIAEKEFREMWSRFESSWSDNNERDGAG